MSTNLKTGLQVLLVKEVEGYPHGNSIRKDSRNDPLRQMDQWVQESGSQEKS